uniref:Ubiquitin carboxyl-terminal hydrolase n=1 Tax=Clastoptera arizonana TaxID=38151 RepID=A0A1B6DXJ4_9HEMI
MAWTPLESNPDVMNKLLYHLGMPDKWQIVDVYGLDSVMLATVPRPVLAVILLFPTSSKYYEHRQQLEEEIKGKGQKVSPGVFFMKQYVQNACGTFALIHSVANNTDHIELSDGALKQFLNEAKPLKPEDRGELLQKAVEIIHAHKEISQEGQTEAPDPSENVNYHFVAFVSKDGDLYELDGSKSFPINHGPSSPDSVLDNAAKIIQDYMALDPDNLHFTVIALTGVE